MDESQVKPAAQGLPSWGLWLGLSLLTIALSAWMRIRSPGWYLLIFGIGLCGLTLVHPVVHAIGARRAGIHRRKMQVVLLVSDLLFMLGFGFQVDYGDAPGGGYMAFQSFAYQVFLGKPGPAVPEDAAGIYFGLAGGSLLGLAASWVVILILTSRSPRLQVAKE